MLLELAIADAYGAGREFAPPEDVAANNDGKTYVQNPVHGDLKPGRYTDDTQMTIGLAEWMLEKFPPNSVKLAEYFVQAFQRDPRPGYAGRFYDFLMKAEDGYDFMGRIEPNSRKAGGAMRASVCGLLGSVEEVRDMAAWQASLTHATFDGMNAAVAAALLVFHHRDNRSYTSKFLYHGGRMPGLMTTTCGFYYDWETPWRGPVGNDGLQAVHAALTAIVESNGTLSDILIRSVAFTGDVDTVATIAIAAASMSKDIDHDLDDSLFRNLEGGKYGWRYLKSLDAKLMKAFPLVTK